jgi:uncharacterized protein
MVYPLKISLVTALLLLTACRSEPIQFHTLTPAQPSGNSRTSAADIQIEGLSVPPQVDRPQIVIRQGNSGLAILETEWCLGRSTGQQQSPAQGIGAAGRATF